MVTLCYSFGSIKQAKQGATIFFLAGFVLARRLLQKGESQYVDIESTFISLQTILLM